MKVYLSGPMTGKPDLNFPAFHANAAWLRSKGFEVVNPAELNPDASLSWAACMRTDIKALCDCEGIVLMEGWEGSSGAHLELHIAHRLEMKIMHMDQVRDYYSPDFLGEALNSGDGTYRP